MPASCRSTVTAVVHTWGFWGLTAVAVVAALVTVGQRRPERAVLSIGVLLAAVDGLSVLLAAPEFAIAQIAMHGTAVAALLWGIVPADRSLDDTEDAARTFDAGVARAGVWLAAVFAVEMAWAFQRVRGADLPSAQPPAEWSVSTIAGPAPVEWLSVVGLAILLLLVVRRGTAVGRHEAR